MSNDISLTIRLPKTLNDDLTQLSKQLGITKVNLLRFAIHLFLMEKPTPLIFDGSSSEKFRFNFHVNAVTNSLLVEASEHYGQPINSVVTAIAYLAVGHYSKYL